MKDPNYCNDYGDPDVVGCLGTIDPTQEMDFSPHGVLHWCSSCGPKAHALSNKMMEAMHTKPGFKEDLKHEINDAYSRITKQ